MARNPNLVGGREKKKNLLRHHIRLAGPANVQTQSKARTPAAPATRSAQARGEAPPSPPPLADTRRAHRKPAPAGRSRGFRLETRRSPFGSGPSPAPARERSRSLNFRDQRLAPACTSGHSLEGKDPVTRLPVSRAAQAAALGAAAPSGAECPVARREGARRALRTFQRNRGPRFPFFRPRKGWDPSLRPAEFPRRRDFAGL